MTLVQRMAVHLLDALDSRDVGPRVVSSETEYFAADGIPRRPGMRYVFQITRLVTHKHTGNLRSKYSPFTTDK